MVWLFLFLQFVYADEAPVVQVMDPMPIIAVDEVKKLPDNQVTQEISVDTEAPSPLAPQTFDGFGGVAQEPFSPTDREQEEILRKQEEAAKRLAIARAAQERKTIVPTTLPKKAGPTAKPISAKVVASKVPPSKVAKRVKPAAKPAVQRASAQHTKKTVAKKPAATVKRLPAAAQPKKPGALKVAPKPNKK